MPDQRDRVVVSQAWGIIQEAWKVLRYTFFVYPHRTIYYFSIKLKR